MLNKVILIGNVGAEPNVRVLDGGVKTASLRVATTKRYKGADGEPKEQTQWHTIECWRNLADIVDKWVKKGDKLYIEGELNYRAYTDKEGVERMMVSVVAQELKMLTPKNEKATPAPQPAIVQSAPVTPAVEPPAPSYDGLPF